MLSLRPISEIEKPRFEWPRHSSTESARSIDGTEYSLGWGMADLNCKQGKASNQLDRPGNVNRNVIDRSIYLDQIMPLCWMIYEEGDASPVLVNLCVSARAGCTAYCNHCRHEMLFSAHNIRKYREFIVQQIVRKKLLGGEIG